MKSSAKVTAQCALLTCAALALSVLEGFIPAAAIPLPGIKLGLANIVILYALYRLGVGYAFMILAAKCILTAIFGGGITSFAFSLVGGILSLTVMALLKKADGKLVTVIGVSTAGAAAHGIGQISAAAVMLKTLSVIYYLPVLLLAGIFTGALTGITAKLLFERI